MELTLVPLLLPAIQQQFGLSIGALAWVFNSYSIAVAIGVLLGGWLGDVFGVRTVFRVGVLLFSSGAALVAMADGYELLILGRIIQGLGGGIFSPLIPILLTSAAPERPGRILIIWGSIVGYVAAFAPLLYGNLLEASNWSIAFVAFGLVSLIALAVVHSSDSGPEDARRASGSCNYRKLLLPGGLWLVFAYVFCTYGSFTYYLFRLPVLLAESGFQAASIGFILSILWLSFSMASTLLRNRVDAPSFRIILLAAPALIALGYCFAHFGSNVWYLAIASSLIGCGLACSNAPSTQLVLQLAPKGMRAVSASLDITFARLGGVATVAVLADAVFGYSVVAIAGLSLVALACAWFVVDEFTV